mmetsp:Transcript_25772/g.84959  ORF Transcript_25772/g.84959 Transcript_25772/m.84959 type:complete len:256 (+) Transcript_25772:55-822(+)
MAHLFFHSYTASSIKPSSPLLSVMRVIVHYEVKLQGRTDTLPCLFFHALDKDVSRVISSFELRLSQSTTTMKITMMTVDNRHDVGPNAQATAGKDTSICLFAHHEHAAALSYSLATIFTTSSLFASQLEQPTSRDMWRRSRRYCVEHRNTPPKRMRTREILTDEGTTEDFPAGTRKSKVLSISRRLERSTEEAAAMITVTATNALFAMKIPMNISFLIDCTPRMACLLSDKIFSTHIVLNTLPKPNTVCSGFLTM